MKIGFSIEWSDLRTMCVDHNYYTCGNNNEYDRMLNSYQGVLITPSKLAEVVEDLARDIKEHSITEDSVEDIANAVLHMVTATTI